MENQQLSNQSDTSSTSPIVVKQPKISPQAKINLVILLLLTFIITGVIFGFAGYYLGRQSSLSKLPKVQNNSQVLPSPTNPEATSSSELVTFTGTTLPITFEHSSKLRVFEGAEVDSGYGRSIQVVYDYPDRSPRFLWIDGGLPNDFDVLKLVEIGESYQDKTITELDIIATRLPDITIGGKTAIVYEWNMLWEIPGPVRDYYIPYQDSYIHIRATYSNIKIENEENPMYTFDYVTAFDQILSSLKFTN